MLAPSMGAAVVASRVAQNLVQSSRSSFQAADIAQCRWSLTARGGELKDWDNNVIHFGETANPDYKMLLITMATFIQLRLFDRRNQQ